MKRNSYRVVTKITDPARETQCVHRVDICKLLTTFLGTNWACLFDYIHTGGLIVIQLLDRLMKRKS